MSSDSEAESNEVSHLHATRLAPVAEPNTQTASLIDNQTVFNAENLIDTLQLDNCSVQYLANGSNYPLDEATRESASNILDPRLLDDFLAGTCDLFT